MIVDMKTYHVGYLGIVCVSIIVGCSREVSESCNTSKLRSPFEFTISSVAKDYTAGSIVTIDYCVSNVSTQDIRLQLRFIKEKPRGVDLCLAPPSMRGEEMGMRLEISSKELGPLVFHNTWILSFYPEPKAVVIPANRCFAGRLLFDSWSAFGVKRGASVEVMEGIGLSQPGEYRVRMILEGIKGGPELWCGHIESNEIVIRVTGKRAVK